MNHPTRTVSFAGFKGPASINAPSFLFPYPRKSILTHFPHPIQPATCFRGADTGYFPTVAAQGDWAPAASPLNVITIRSFVAGIASFTARPPHAWLNASFTAVQAEIPKSSRGSPSALLRLMLTAQSAFSKNATLKTSGTSEIFGILYVVGECEVSRPFAS